MRNHQSVIACVRLLNILISFSILAILFTTLIIQLYWHELPCTLCLLQRYGFLAMGLGLLLNLRVGFHAAHYGITILSAMFTGLVGLRQVALHALPGSPGYGSPLLGLHLYTWSFVVSMFFIILLAVLQSVDKQYLNDLPVSKRARFYTHLLFVLFVSLVIFNIVSVILQCGIHWNCPEDPVGYLLLNNIK